MGLSLGIQSELGRGGGLDREQGTAFHQRPLNRIMVQKRLLLNPQTDTDFYYLKSAKEQELGRELSTDEFPRDYYGDGTGKPYNTGTSIFDPVLCELAYTWFCPTGGLVLDPFAGGSVRGIVACYLGYRYIGLDLLERQVNTNKEQADNILKDDNKPSWIVWDSRYISELLEGKFNFDFIFTCPPYFDLEQYSDDPADLSNTGDYSTFLKAYWTIIAQSISLLKDNRFACFVISDIRDKKGFYRGFVSDTISAFESAGARLYNEAILINVAGSLPIRVSNQFPAYRKLGREHQNFLVFYKEDIAKIKELALR